MATKYFETQGPVDAAVNYVVSRKAELADFIARVKRGRYIVMFAPRQTGKTTFFRWALAELAAADATYFPIQLNFEIYAGYPAARFYPHFAKKLREAIERVFRTRNIAMPPPLAQFLANAQIADRVEMLDFFEAVGQHLTDYRIVLLIDEFDGIPADAVQGFLHALRHIYISDVAIRCPYSVGIVGVKNVTQLNYDRTISPFNIQEEFHLPNFTLAQVQELLGQYTAEVGQPFEPEVIETLHRQTGDNRCLSVVSRSCSPRNWLFRETPPFPSNTSRQRISASSANLTPTFSISLPTSAETGGLNGSS